MSSRSTLKCGSAGPVLRGSGVVKVVHHHGAFDNGVTDAWRTYGNHPIATPLSILTISSSCDQIAAHGHAGP